MCSVLPTITERKEKAGRQTEKKKIDVIAMEGFTHRRRFDLTNTRLLRDRSYFCNVAKGVVKLFDTRFEDRRLWRYNELEVRITTIASHVLGAVISPEKILATEVRVEPRYHDLSVQHSLDADRWLTRT